MSPVHLVNSLAWCEATCGDHTALRVTLRPEDVTCPACLATFHRPRIVMPENALLKAVRDAAQAYGWLSYHTYRSDRSEKGWPDVALAKPGHPLHLLELKTAQGKLTVEQERWLTTLAQCTGVQAQVVRPADLPALVAVLRGA